MPRRLRGRTVAIASAIAAGAFFLPATAAATGAPGYEDGVTIWIQEDPGNVQEVPKKVVIENPDGYQITDYVIVKDPSGNEIKYYTVDEDDNEVVVTPKPETGSGEPGGGVEPGEGTGAPTPGDGTDVTTKPENPLAGLFDVLKLAFGS